MPQPNLKPEAVEALRQMIDRSRALSKALAALVNQPSREFKADPEREYIDRSQAMQHVLAIRDAHYELCEVARQSVVALGVTGGSDAALHQAGAAGLLPDSEIADVPPSDPIKTNSWRNSNGSCSDGMQEDGNGN